MAAYDPRIVSRALEDIEDQLSLWSEVAREAQSQAHEQQQHADEQAAQSVRSVEIARETITQSEAVAQQDLEAAKVCVASCERATEIARHTLQQAQQTVSRAQLVLTTWEGELDKATRWLERAEQRLAQAQRALDAAISELSSAQSALSWAESRLRDCQNDKNRTECNSEAAAVRAAQNRVWRAEAAVAATREQVQEAEREVSRARTRLEHCRSALICSKQAVSHAEESEKTSWIAVTEAERGLEVAHSMDSRASQSLEQISQGKQFSASIQEAATKVTSFVDAAKTFLAKADEQEASAQELANSARREMDQRQDALRQADSTSDFAGLAAVGIVGPAIGAASGALSRKELGDSMEQKVARDIKARFGYDIVGTSLHYAGNQGIDLYAIRNTPKGYSVAFFEVKSTADPTLTGSTGQVMNRLYTDTSGLGQGSPAWNDDRLSNAAMSGRRRASWIQDHRAMAGEGRVWQTRHYVVWANAAKGDISYFRAVSNAPRSAIINLIPWR